MRSSVSSGLVPSRTGGPQVPVPALAGTDTGELWRVSPEARWTLVAKGLPQVQAILPLV